MKYLVLGIGAALIITSIVLSIKSRNKENFTADGYFVVPPNWFIKQTYDPSQWLVRQYVDTIQPECLSYSKASKYGSLENVNYMASASRFWRM